LEVEEVEVLVDAQPLNLLAHTLPVEGAEVEEEHLSVKLGQAFLQASASV
jgi:hypothetical protein